jgi:hypothetical protein
MQMKKPNSLSAAATAVAEKKTTTPAVQLELENLMRGDAGHGVSTKAEDNLVPRVKVLQPLSPQVLDGTDKVDGARPGDFLLGDQLLAGKSGFWFQPCSFTQVWLEFKPLDQGGGFVGAHSFTREDEPPPGTIRYDKMKHKFSASGNECIHYRQVAGIAWQNQQGLEYVVTFKSTGHTIAREWMTIAGRANRYDDGKPRPLYSHIYRLTTSQRKNQAGQWFVIDVGAPLLLLDADAAQIVGDSMRAYVMGKALASAFDTGEKHAEVDETVNDN